MKKKNRTVPLPSYNGIDEPEINESLEEGKNVQQIMQEIEGLQKLLNEKLEKINNTIDNKIQTKTSSSNSCCGVTENYFKYYYEIHHFRILFNILLIILGSIFTIANRYPIVCSIIMAILLVGSLVMQFIFQFAFEEEGSDIYRNLTTVVCLISFLFPFVMFIITLF